MTYALVASNCLTVLAAVWAYVRLNDRWTSLFQGRSDGWDSERSSLLNRIQAPERAVALSIEPDDRKHYISEGDEDRRFEEALNADG